MSSVTSPGNQTLHLLSEMFPPHNEISNSVCESKFVEFAVQCPTQGLQNEIMVELVIWRTKYLNMPGN